MIVNLTGKKFYTVCKLDGGSIVVNGSQGGSLSSNSIDENTQTDALKGVSIADEQIVLHDGKN